MRVVQVSFFRDPRHRLPEELLRDWPALTDVAAAVAGAGVEVRVVQAASRSAALTHGGVTVHFVREQSRWWTARARWLTAPSRALLERVAEFDPDVVHVHGLGFPLALRHTSRVIGRPVLVQDHADRPPAPPLRRLTAGALRRSAGVAFTARTQAEPWRAAGCLPATLPVFEVPESSSHFTPGDRAAARQASGVFGEPAVAWVGRLNPVKDPVTAVEAFAEAAPALPDAHLWCCFTEDALRPRIEAMLRTDARLRGRVHLLGHLPHPGVETLLRACDLYLAASRREGSGFALLEALACGLPAVVTDIPSFRRLGGDGAVAELVPPGVPGAMARALVERHGRPLERAAVRAFFDAHLSFAAVGAALRAAYEQVVGA